jgi:uncharacterized protein YbjT (DUF2867 family)
MGVEPYVCDLENTDELIRAFDGAEAAYVMIPPTFDPLHRMRTGGRAGIHVVIPSKHGPDFRNYQERISDSLATAIKEAGVPHVVSLSSIGADKSHGTGTVVGLHSLEQKLNRIPGLNVLHLRAGYLMENTFGQAESIRESGHCGGTLRPDLKVPMIATRDISAMAADELLQRKFSGKQTRELHGQRDISMMEVAAILGKVTGQPGIEYQHMSHDQFRPILVEFGLSLDLADLILETLGAMNSGKMNPQEPRSARNTTPTSYETFAAEEFLPRFQQSRKMAA